MEAPSLRGALAQYCDDGLISAGGIESAGCCSNFSRDQAYLGLRSVLWGGRYYYQTDFKMGHLRGRLSDSSKGSELTGPSPMSTGRVGPGDTPPAPPQEGGRASPGLAKPARPACAAEPRRDDTASFQLSFMYSLTCIVVHVTIGDIRAHTNSHSE